MMAHSAVPATAAGAAVRHIVTVATDSVTLRICRYIGKTFALSQWFYRDFYPIKKIFGDCCPALAVRFARWTAIRCPRFQVRLWMS